MRKQLRQYLRRSLCGVLSAAMILAGSAIPDMAVQAAQTNVEDFTEADEQINETPSAETDENDEIGNPDADNDVAGGAENIDQENSGQKDEDASDEQGENDAVGSEDDDEKLSDDETGSGDGESGDFKDDLEDIDAADDDAEEDIKPITKKSSVGVMATKDGRTTYGKLVNGDFSEFDEANNWAPTAWKLNPAYDGNNDFKTQTIDEDHGKDSLYIYRESETDISVSQVIPNMEPGAYMVVLDAGGVYSKDQITLKVESVEQKDDSDEDYTEILDELTTQSLDECDAWGKWNTVETEIFEVKVPTEKTEVNVKITISGKIGIDSKAEQIHIDNVEFVTYKLADLQELLTSVADFEEADYTAETWTTFAEKKEAAQDLVNDGATTDAAKALEIMQAYLALEKAKEELKSSSTDVEVTFYYYAGETDDEIGLYCWDDSGESNISTTADPIDDWYVWNANDTYKMTEVMGYAGWYSVPIKFKSGGAKAGFQVYTKTKASSTEDNYEYKCDETDNKEAYAALTSGESKTCAVKNKNSYFGTYDIGKEDTEADKAAMIMRNITLNVYSEDIIPVIQLDNNSAAKKLSVINETDGSISDLTPSETDQYDNPYYELERAAEDSYWYTLSFSVPGAIDFTKKEKICGLFDKTADGYAWLKDLTNGSTGESYQSDLTPVFKGEVWGKYDSEANTLTFYSTQDAAAKITLAMLNALLESDEVKAISATKGEGYTEASWNVFDKAKSVAENVVADNSPASDAISSAYVRLKDAVKNMEVQITLAMLNALLESDDVNTITTNGQEAYTEASWTAFDTAKNAAKIVADKYKEQDGSYASDDISKAYENLQDAVKNMQTVDGDDDTITLYFHSKALNDYTDSETETYHLYMSTWNKSKIASSKEEVQLSQGTWEYTAYLFDEVTDEAVNMGYKNWYSIPVKRIAANDGADGDGFIIQTGKAEVSGEKTTHTALESDVGLITLSYWANSDIYSQIASMEKGGSIAIKDGKAFASIQEAEDGTKITKKLEELVKKASLLEEKDYKKGWEEFTKALEAAVAVLKVAEEAEKDTSKDAPTQEQVDKAYNS